MSRADIAASLAALDAVSLDELNATAELQTRVDRKYALTRPDAEALVAALASTLSEAPRVLQIGAARATRYESTYFDTPELLSYRLAAHARRRRFKVRTRSYLDSSASFLEVKTRGARSATVKERMPYEPTTRDRLEGGGVDYAETALAPLGFEEVVPALTATIVTRYERATLLLPGSSSRVTIDTELAWEHADGAVLERPELVIVETKSRSRVGEVDRLLWARGQRPVALSKFGTGLAALDPSLPANKWARVLRRHFDQAPRLRAA